MLHMSDQPWNNSCGSAAILLLAYADHQTWGVSLYGQEPSNGTNQKHQKAHANQLISGKFWNLPVIFQDTLLCNQNVQNRKFIITSWVNGEHCSKCNVILQYIWHIPLVEVPDSHGLRITLPLILIASPAFSVGVKASRLSMATSDT